jgi:hypothetical protein
MNIRVVITAMCERRMPTLTFASCATTNEEELGYIKSRVSIFHFFRQIRADYDISIDEH